MLRGHEDMQCLEPPSAVPAGAAGSGSALLSPREGGDFQTPSPRVSCSTGGCSVVHQEMVEELWSFPACSHRVNQPQRREELPSFPWGSGGSGQAGSGGWQVQPELWKGFCSMCWPRKWVGEQQMGDSHGLGPAQPHESSAGFTLCLLGTWAELAPLTSKKPLTNTQAQHQPWWGLPCAGTPSWQCCHATSPLPLTKATLDEDKRPSVTLSGAMGMTHVHQSTAQDSVLTDRRCAEKNLVEEFIFC